MGSPALDFSGALEDSGRTLTEIYDALVGLITDNTVKLGSTYLGVAGTLTPDGGTATTTDVFAGKTVHISNDWTLDTGTLNLACNVANFDGTDNKVANAYDGAGDGTNRWCMTSSGDAATTDILAGKIAFVDGAAITGVIETKTLSAASETLGAGYYATTTLSAADSDLATANIKSGITIFGIDGNSNVVDTSSGDAAAGNLLADKICWADGAAITGTMANVGAQTVTPGTANTTITAGYHNGSGYCAGDANLISANIKSGVTIFSVAGDSNVVDTSSGDATAADVADGKIAFVDGAALTGSMFTNQQYQTIDDWLNSGGTSGEYISEEATWTTATTTFSGASSIDYATTSDNTVRILDLASNTVKIDDRTGLWWTDAASYDGLTAPTTTENYFTLTADGSRPTGGSAIGFCNALNTYNSNDGFGGYTDWYLPTQKELMQAYIDGAANNLPNPGYYFWSSTQYYNDAAYAWRVTLSYGSAYTNTKATRAYVRCVRRP